MLILGGRGGTDGRVVLATAVRMLVVDYDPSIICRSIEGGAKKDQTLIQTPHHSMNEHDRTKMTIIYI